MGVLRHADAGYSRAIDFAKEHDVKIPMESQERDR
jgi:urocanate hydratase